MVNRAKMTVVLLALSTVGAFADEADVRETCTMVDMDRLLISVAAGHSEWMGADALNVARGMFMATPPMTPVLPRGEKAVLFRVDDGKGMVLFLDGVITCERLQIGPDSLKMLDDVKAGHWRTSDHS